MSSTTTSKYEESDENNPPLTKVKGTEMISSSSQDRPRKKQRESSSAALKISAKDGGKAQPGSKYRGVCRNRDKWQAVIWVQGKRKYLGTFKDEESAAKAYDTAATEYRGERASLNFPKSEFIETSGASRNKTEQGRKMTRAKRKRKRTRDDGKQTITGFPAHYDSCPQMAFFRAASDASKRLPFETQQDVVQAYNAAVALRNILYSTPSSTLSSSSSSSLQIPPGAVNKGLSVVGSKSKGARSSREQSSPIRAK